MIEFFRGKRIDEGEKKMEIKLPKYKMLDEVYYADFVALNLHKSKIIGVSLQQKGLSPVYYLDNGLSVDEDNLYLTKHDAKERLIKLFDKFKKNLNG